MLAHADVGMCATVGCPCSMLVAGLVTLCLCACLFAQQDLLEDSHAHGTDASGNPILKDIGMFMRSELKSYFKDADIKYIDPSYIIR